MDRPVQGLVDWSKVFNEVQDNWPIDKDRSDIVEKLAPKFHDIPLELQIGILSRYLHESLDCQIGSAWLASCPFVRERLIEDLDWHFFELDKQLT